MKISELTALKTLERAAQIPVALLGENRSISLGQLLEALQSSIVPFDGIVPDSVMVIYGEGGSNAKLTPVWDPATKKFYGAYFSGTTTLYSSFVDRARFYDEDGNVREDCLFIASDGRLYYFNGKNLISAGLTNKQAELLQKLTPKPVASEGELEAMQKAGEIVPGQIYYIPETE